MIRRAGLAMAVVAAIAVGGCAGPPSAATTAGPQRFLADAPGIFEVEMHESGPLTVLRVLL